MGQQQSSSSRIGRHRQENLRRHRAPALPALFATRSRSTLSVTALGATLAAGVGAASMSAAAAPTGVTSGLPTAAHATAALPIVPPPGDQAPGKEYPRLDPAPDTGGPAAAPVRRKVRPLPKRNWVHPLPSASVTSCFGPRWGRLHAGVDLAAPHGAPVVAAGAGTVVAAGANGGYGNAVLIDHGNGYLTHYGHLSVIGVEVGRVVKAGEHIGDEGSTGRSTGPHLHFEVHEGHFQNPVEPTTWMREHGVEISGCSEPAS
ncbi:M23 family metallopeptidase [Actinoplanes sp. NPDC049802]|uniref:M23 family metallopeptidase n=1 Tax=Actinoplanes sp. NPDC049802 TaxID=3154742 RepID=UPI0033F679A5